jgi:hypothetical protein
MKDFIGKFQSFRVPAVNIRKSAKAEFPQRFFHVRLIFYDCCCVYAVEQIHIFVLDTFIHELVKTVRCASMCKLATLGQIQRNVEIPQRFFHVCFIFYDCYCVYAVEQLQIFVLDTFIQELVKAVRCASMCKLATLVQIQRNVEFPQRFFHVCFIFYDCYCVYAVEQLQIFVLDTFI